MTAILRRRPEAAHIRLLEAERLAAERLAAERLAAERLAVAGEEVGGIGFGSGDAPEDEHTATIHDRVMAKEEGLAGRIAYDWHERRSGLVHLLDVATTQDDYANAAYDEQGDFVDQPFEVVSLDPGLLRIRRDGSFHGAAGPQAVRIEKTLALGGDRVAPSARLDVTVTNRSGERIATVLAVDWALNMLGGGGNPQAYYRVGAERTTHDGRGAHEDAEVVSFGNDWLGLAVDAVAEPDAAVWWQPIETISNSEGGFERIYQGSSLLFRWPLDLSPGASMTARMRLDVRCARDRAAEELMAAGEPVAKHARTRALVGEGTGAHRGR
jgi:alpha-amylase